MRLADLRKYNPNEPRDSSGRWTTGGASLATTGAAAAGAAAGGLAAHAAIGRARAKAFQRLRGAAAPQTKERLTSKLRLLRHRKTQARIGVALRNPQSLIPTAVRTLGSKARRADQVVTRHVEQHKLTIDPGKNVDLADLFGLDMAPAETTTHVISSDPMGELERRTVAANLRSQITDLKANARTPEARNARGRWVRGRRRGPRPAAPLAGMPIERRARRIVEGYPTKKDRAALSRQVRSDLETRAQAFGDKERQSLLARLRAHRPAIKAGRKVSLSVLRNLRGRARVAAVATLGALGAVGAGTFASRLIGPRAKTGVDTGNSGLKLTKTAQNAPIATKPRQLTTDPLLKAFNPNQARDADGRWSGSSPTMTVLIGPPASGKSTWRATNRPRAVLISTDAVLAREKLATTPENINRAVKLARRDFRAAVLARKNIVLDRTNPTVKSRARWLSLLPANYRRHAVVFDTPARERAWHKHQREAAGIGVQDPRLRTEVPTEHPREGEFDQVETVTRDVSPQALAWAKRGKLLKAFEEAKHPRDDHGRWTDGNASRQATVKGRLAQLRAAGDRRLVYRGAPRPDFKPRDRHYGAVFVTTSKSRAAGYANPTSITGKPIGAPGWVTAYALPSAVPLADMRRLYSQPLSPLQARAKVRWQAHLSRGMKNPSLGQMLRDARLYSRDDPDSDPGDQDAILEAIHTGPTLQDNAFLTRQGLKGTRRAEAIALIDPSVLRPIYARRTDAGRRIVLAKAAPGQSEDNAQAIFDAGTRVENTLATRLAHVFGTWTQLPATLIAAGDELLRATLVSGIEQALAPLDRAGTGGAGVPVPGVDWADPAGGRLISASFDIAHPAAVDVITNKRLKLAGRMADEQLATVRSVLVDATFRGQAPATTARLLRQTIGLTPTQAGHVTSYRYGLDALDPRVLDRALRDARYDRTIRRAIDTGTPLSDEQINRMTDAYQRRYLAYRALTISRTEGLGAANGGHMDGVAEFLAGNPDMTLIKTWIATNDPRTRDTHVYLNRKQVIGIDTPFISSTGEKLRWPHDPNASAAEVVNCRCTCGTMIVPRVLAAERGLAAADVGAEAA